jgi:hypothetical protein
MRQVGRKRGSKAKGSGEWKPVFLAALQKLPVVHVACQASGISRAEVYRARTRDADFALAWEQALQDGIDVIEAQLMARAIKSDTIASIFILKNRRPEIYGENVNVNVSGTLSVEEVHQARASLHAKLTQIIDIVAPGDQRLITE